MAADRKGNNRALRPLGTTCRPLERDERNWVSVFHRKSQGRGSKLQLPDPKGKGSGDYRTEGGMREEVVICLKNKQAPRALWVSLHPLSTSGLRRKLGILNLRFQSRTKGERLHCPLRALIYPRHQPKHKSHLSECSPLSNSPTPRHRGSSSRVSRSSYPSHCVAAIPRDKELLQQARSSVRCCCSAHLRPDTRHAPRTAVATHIPSGPTVGAWALKQETQWHEKEMQSMSQHLRTKKIAPAETSLLLESPNWKHFSRAPWVIWAPK